MTSDEALALGPHGGLVVVYTPGAPRETADGTRPAVVMFNPGLIHHVGPHRLHVKLSRALAVRGISSARVDFAGVGDSINRPDRLSPAELLQHELGDVLRELADRGHRAFVLFGLCSGALAAREMARTDHRIRGVILVNSASDADSRELSEATTHLYLRHSIRRPQAWRNLVTGRVNYRMLLRSLTTVLGSRLRFAAGNAVDRQSLNARRRLQPLLDGGVPVLAILSDRHAAAFAVLDDDFEDLRRSGQLQLESFPQFDHLFTPSDAEETLIETVCRWTASLRFASPEEPIPQPAEIRSRD